MPASISPSRTPTHAVALWLYGVAFLVFAMILLGGATRLTQSGLSMVDWRPLMGIVPPLDKAAWVKLFEAYKAFPEYRQINLGMSLGEFKAIFWFEYSHRLLGRLIGLAFLLPFLWFLWRGVLSKPLVWRLAGVFALGGLQGLVGWWMVKSGLIDRPDVSHYRLAVHLGLALAILGLLLWHAWELGQGAMDRAREPHRLHWLAWLCVGWLYLQIILGAFVAGLDAGRHYNSFPTMNGVWLPDELWRLQPWWQNLFDNAATVQFEHRIGAYVAVLLVLTLWYGAMRAGAPRRTVHLMALALLAQFALGVATLLFVVPVGLGVLHQAGAMVLFAATLRVTFDLAIEETSP